MLRPRAQKALENVDSFQYTMYKRYQETNSGPEKNKKIGPSFFLLPGALEILAYFDPWAGL